jgi:hypothetical protein
MTSTSLRCWLATAYGRSIAVLACTRAVALVIGAELLNAPLPAVHAVEQGDWS